jgi:hypothetical protein
MSFSLTQEGPIGCPSCGQVIEGRKEVPTKVVLPPRVEAAPAGPSDWGCTDLLEPVPVVPKPVELPPDPLPEYITADQARKWGIKIRFMGESK